MRARLSAAERELWGAIQLIRGRRDDETRATLARARELYVALAADFQIDSALRLALDRRVRVRIDRALASLSNAEGVEYFDVLGATGTHTGEREASTLAHLRGTCHASVEVLVFNQTGSLLMQQREPAIAIFPGKWTLSATGHLSSGQSPPAAAKAEIEEEISAPLAQQEPPAASSWLRLAPRAEKLEPLLPVNRLDNHLLLYEFIYLDAAEKHLLEHVLKESTRDQPREGLERVLWDFHESARTLCVYTFLPALHASLGRVVDRLCEAVPPGVMTDNVEKKNLFAYRLDSSEERLVEEIMALKGKGAGPYGDGLVSGFQWARLDIVLARFRRWPEDYTDSFMPYFIDPQSIDAMLRFQRGS